MAEDDTPKRAEDDEDATPIVVPSHAPLPPPPEVHYTRPVIEHRSRDQRALSPRTTDSESQGAAGHGAGLAAGMTFITSILAGLVAGNWLDQHYIHSATPWGLLVMTLVGTAVGFTNMFRLMSRGGRRKP